MGEVRTILERRAARVPRDIVELRDGLSSRELGAAERAYGSQFSADHRRFLSAMFPTGPGWPDWREPENRALHEWLDRPREGVLFDVEANAFWPEQWGPRPVDAHEALRVADREVRTWPRSRGTRICPPPRHVLVLPCSRWSRPTLSTTVRTCWISLGTNTDSLETRRRLIFRHIVARRGRFLRATYMGHD